MSRSEIFHFPYNDVPGIAADLHRPGSPPGTRGSHYAWPEQTNPLLSLRGPDEPLVVIARSGSDPRVNPRSRARSPEGVRGNPVHPASGDCFVAVAPRNDNWAHGIQGIAVELHRPVHRRARAVPIWQEQTNPLLSLRGAIATRQSCSSRFRGLLRRCRSSQ